MFCCVVCMWEVSVFLFLFFVNVWKLLKEFLWLDFGCFSVVVGGCTKYQSKYGEKYFWPKASFQLSQLKPQTLQLNLFYFIKSIIIFNENSLVNLFSFYSPALSHSRSSVICCYMLACVCVCLCVGQTFLVQSRWPHPHNYTSQSSSFGYKIQQRNLFYRLCGHL